MALPFLVCKDVFDSSGVDEASLAVVFEVVESHGDAAQGLESAVDGFGGSVGRVSVREVGQDVGAASFQGAPQGSQLGAAACGCRFGQCVDERAHHASAPARVLVPVAGDDALVGAVRQPQRVVDGVDEQCVDAFPLAWGAQRGGLEQGAPAVVEAFALDAAPARGLALQAAAHHGEPAGGQMHDMERVAGLDRRAQHAGGGLLPSGERVHGHDLDAVAEACAPRFEPVRERLRRTARHHVQQSGRSAVGARGQVDDHGHVPVAGCAVAPHVLVHADARHRPVRVGFGQDPHAGRAHRPVQRVPRAAQRARARRHRRRLQRDAARRPVHRGPRQQRASRRQRPQVVVPHTRARDALIGAHPHLQMDRVRSQGHVHDGAFTRGAHPAHAAARDTRPRRFVPRVAADLPHARTVPATKKTHGPGAKTQPIQPQQALTIEHAKIRDRPCPILFIIHTTNDGARPLHTKKGRASFRPNTMRNVIMSTVCIQGRSQHCRRIGRWKANSRSVGIDASG